MDPFNDTTLPSISSQLKEGVIVFNIRGKRIGLIKYIQHPAPPTSPALENFPYDLATTDIPEETAYNLLRTGFVCVDAGFLAKDRLIPMDLFAIILGNKALLKTEGEDLITL